MTDDINYPWVEEFRPVKLSDVIGADHHVTKFNEFVTTKSLPHLLFVGEPGTGKTTVAKILAKEISGDEYLYINASDERGMDVIRNKVQDFCMVSSFSELKIIILDEADGLTVDAQKILRAVTEQYAKNCRFILTANYENRLIDPVKSRFQMFKFEGASKNEIAKRCWQILKLKNVQLDEKSKEDMIYLVKTYYPDIRSVINNMQRCCVNTQLFRYVASNKTVELTKKFVELLKNKSIRAIREEILVHSVDFDEFYNIVYENVKELTADTAKMAEIIVILADYQYKNTIHPNKELNFVACLIEIVNSLKG